MNFLKAERIYLNLPQKEVFEEIGVNKGTFIRWEAGYAIPSDKLALLAELGFDVQFIITGKRSFSADFDFNLQEKAIEIVAKYIHRSGLKLAYPEMVYPVAMEIYQVLKQAQDESVEVDPVELGAKVIQLFAT
ncbi:helix-turn-helix domain-containing protein [Shewanella sp. D64]|uniref:helix-turn-helix domain-containing protein n=1 Tax=unclassified Shewanella TaxID=196818 RepID=UPI0022BA307D|nr:MULTISPECIES: helix-turn-helix transcriptional regulator [unclassified Shewanella]MEC4724540.1 helix-turn-helix domain-containing protein [Shewanella sp. D64]MEC4736683.1 helix-turn-helix domain-containing protein [Shewanella sp. E94]WBJ94647.1 helix-turn-helix domain-containing protein [Shewanella sp. MTB7]